MSYQLTSAAQISAVPPGILETEIIPVLDGVLTDPASRGSVSKRLPSQELKTVLGVRVRLRQQGVLAPGASFGVWAERTLSEVQEAIARTPAPCKARDRGKGDLATCRQGSAAASVDA